MKYSCGEAYFAMLITNVRHHTYLGRCQITCISRLPLGSTFTVANYARSFYFFDCDFRGKVIFQYFAYDKCYIVTILSFPHNPSLRSCQYPWLDSNQLATHPIKGRLPYRIGHKDTLSGSGPMAQSRFPGFPEKLSSCLLVLAHDIDVFYMLLHVIWR